VSTSALQAATIPGAPTTRLLWGSGQRPC
jgi:hypothetical protein